MFQSATLRLTAAYLGIIMVISLIFSITLYSQLNGELRNSYEREANYYQVVPMMGANGQIKYVTPAQVYDRAHHALQLRLVLVNLAIVAAAGFAAWYLARRTLRPIQNAMAAQSRFAADASHELRTPLTAMKSEIEVALRGKDLSSTDAREILASNLEEIDRLETLSAGLLKLARQDRQSLDRRPCSLEEVVDAATKRLGKKLAERHVIVSPHLGNLSVSGDRDSLVELIVTLIDNAIKYSDMHTKVTVSAERHGGTVFIDVSDEGHGISAEDAPHIFERFYRADSSRTRGIAADGYGLGLSIAKQIVDLHDGSIGVASTPGVGSTFTVKLPAA